MGSHPSLLNSWILQGEELIFSFFLSVYLLVTQAPSDISMPMAT